jgi:hypothetical protein
MIILGQSCQFVSRPGVSASFRFDSSRESRASTQHEVRDIIGSMSLSATETVPDSSGHFGDYGGRYVPETLIHPLQELQTEYERAQEDAQFQKEFDYYLREFCGRPTPLYFAERLTRELGGAKIYLKREDLLHTGLTKSTTASAKSCWRGEWAKRASLRRQAPGNMAWRLRRWRRCSDSSA